MKPETCALCDEHSINNQQYGEWVMFADYQALEVHETGHPPGFEFFCKTHAPYAKSFSSMPAKQAINLLKQNLSLYTLVTQPSRPNKWMRFISKLYRIKLLADAD